MPTDVIKKQYTHNTKKTTTLKGYFTSGKMNLYLKWVTYVEEM